MSNTTSAEEAHRTNVALAKAIGWKDYQIGRGDDTGRLYIEIGSLFDGWRIFDYRDWGIIGPIAERYNLFPRKMPNNLWLVETPMRMFFYTTPQRAIAQAVIIEEESK